jgi:hypothetical protein
MLGMTLENQMEQFSHAYVRAVASVAGFSVSRPEVDDDSIDLAIYCRGPRGTVRSPRLELQLKCTSRPLLSAGGLSFDLKIKNYDDLRWSDVAVPRILVLVVVPDQLTEWLEQDQEKLVLRRCGYWMSLRGRKPSGNQSTVRVACPTDQFFSVQALHGIMNTIGGGGFP